MAIRMHPHSSRFSHSRGPNESLKEPWTDSSGFFLSHSLQIPRLNERRRPDWTGPRQSLTSDRRRHQFQQSIKAGRQRNALLTNAARPRLIQPRLGIQPSSLLNQAPRKSNHSDCHMRTGTIDPLRSHAFQTIAGAAKVPREAYCLAQPVRH